MTGMPNGAMSRCPYCGADEIYEDGRFFCLEDCRKVSGSGEGEASGPEPTSTAR